MKTNFFLIHSTEGHPHEAWYPWLEAEMKQRGYEVTIPKFPTPECQSLTCWMKVLESYNNISENTIFIGRSIGVPFILRILENQKAKAAFLVAGFCQPIEGKYAPLVNSFVEKPFIWDVIKKNCKVFKYYYADNDPYLTQAQLKEVPNKLGIKSTLVKGAGHFNTTSGYAKFPMILSDIEKVCASE